MTVDLPSDLANGCSPEWVSLHFAIGLYVSHQATLGQAAKVAGLSQNDFQRELAARKVPLSAQNDESKREAATPKNPADSQAKTRLQKFQEKVDALWAGSNLEFSKEEIVQNLRESRE